MAFIINKKSNKHGKIRNLFYLVEGNRINGKVKRKTIYSLGENKNLNELIVSIKTQIQNKLTEIKKIEEQIITLRQNGGNMFRPFWKIRPLLFKRIENEKEAIEKLQDKLDEVELLKVKHSQSVVPENSPDIK
jgi:hypothetical protein